MKKNKGIVWFILIILIAFFSLKIIELNSEKIESQPEDAVTLSGIGKGKSGDILVEVVINNKKIKHIEIIEHNETPGFDKAMVRLIDDIVAKNSVDVDVITGSTITSKGFISAVKNALSKYEVDEELNVAIEEVETNVDDNYQSEILIIGGGGAGFTAAIEAASLGAKSVTIIEKMPFGGGNTRMSGGEFAAPGNWVQVEEGIENDSVELFYNDIYEGGYRQGKPELVRILAENALDNALWLRDFVGVKYRDEQSWYGGHTVARTLWPEGDGPKYIDTLIKKALDMGVNVEYNTRAEEFIQNEDGRVIGVIAINNGIEKRFYGNKGVILATGGFGANVEMRMEYDTQWGRLDASIPTTNSPAIVGDGIVMAGNIGANLIGMGAIQLYPVNNPATGNYYFMDYARLMSNALLINKEGKRFVDEKETRDNIAKATIFQPSATSYELIDSKVIEEMDLEGKYRDELLRGYDQGVIFKGTLEECSKFFDIPVEQVEHTVERYNSFVESGADLDFNRTKDLRKIEEGPYIMFASVVSVHHTMGGVEIDTSAQVLNENGDRIEGLYAAGEVTGGIHGGNRLGSLSIPDTVTFGRIAARSAVNNEGVFIPVGNK